MSFIGCCCTLIPTSGQLRYCGLYGFQFAFISFINVFILAIASWRCVKGRLRKRGEAWQLFSSPPRETPPHLPCTSTLSWNYCTLLNTFAHCCTAARDRASLTISLLPLAFVTPPSPLLPSQSHHNLDSYSLCPASRLCL